MTDKPEIFFVLKGLFNGDDGVSAITTAGRMMADGWYFLYGDDVDGVGPFDSKDAAQASAAFAVLQNPATITSWEERLKDFVHRSDMIDGEVYRQVFLELIALGKVTSEEIDIALCEVIKSYINSIPA